MASEARQIDQFLIDPGITTAQFACDLERCKGACCTMPGQRGAPLLDKEVEEIEKAFPVVRKYLSFRHKDTIEERGLIQGRRGDYTTQVVDKRACVFAIFENEIAKCSFEKAFLAGEISWRKPISCHLFPIRVSRGEKEQLRFELIAECRPALERGIKESVPLWEFLRTSLTRAYGESWYEEFESYCRTRKETGIPAKT
jgi:hypothetical protein